MQPPIPRPTLVSPSWYFPLINFLIDPILRNPFHVPKPSKLSPAHLRGYRSRDLLFNTSAFFILSTFLTPHDSSQIIKSSYLLVFRWGAERGRKCGGSHRNHHKATYFLQRRHVHMHGRRICLMDRTNSPRLFSHRAPFDSAHHSSLYLQLKFISVFNVAPIWAFFRGFFLCTDPQVQITWSSVCIATYLH